MARKTNCVKNGVEYYRLTASIGRDSDGKLIRKEFYGKSKKDAEDKRDEYLNGLQNGLNVDYKNIVFGDLMHLWLFEVMKVKVKPSSFERYEGIYRNYLLTSELYGLKLSTIKTIQIQRYYNELFEKGKSSSVIENLNKLLKTFMNYAVAEGYILKNPCLSRKIIIPHNKELEGTSKVEIFTDEELSLLKKELENHKFKCLILMALGTGLRQGELLALKWDDIDMDACEVRVNKSVKNVKLISVKDTKRKIIEQTPKSQASIRTIPIPSSLVPILEEHKKHQDMQKENANVPYNDKNLIFATETGEYIKVKNLFNNYKKLLIKAKIKHKKFHALRHTYATKLFENEVSLKTVQTLLGHSDISITADIYTHVMPKEKIKAVEKLNNLFN